MSYIVLPADKHPRLYEMLSAVMGKHHGARLCGEHPCRIVLAVALKWTENADGQMRLGQCKKATDIDRQLHGYDFVIVLNTDLVSAAGNISDIRLEAVLDHELCHAAPALDQHGQARGKRLDR